MRVLVIDYDSEGPSAIAMRLASEGCEVECAVETDEALALLGNVVFHAVVIEVRPVPFGGVGAMRVLGFIRERAMVVRTVVITSRAGGWAEEEARRLGMDVVLIRPFTTEALIESLDRVRELPA